MNISWLNWPYQCKDEAQRGRMPCQCRTLHCSSLFRGFFSDLFQWPNKKPLTGSCHFHQCLSFTSLYIVLVKFYASAPHRLHHGHTFSKKLITSTASLRVSSVPTGAEGALPVPPAWLLLWASWACFLALGSYEVPSSSRKLVWLFPRPSHLGSSWAAARTCFSARLRKQMCSVHLFSAKVRHV